MVQVFAIFVAFNCLIVVATCLCLFLIFLLNVSWQKSGQVALTWLNCIVHFGHSRIVCLSILTINWLTSLLNLFNAALRLNHRFYQILTTACNHLRILLRTKIPQITIFVLHLPSSCTTIWRIRQILQTLHRCDLTRFNIIDNGAGIQMHLLKIRWRLHCIWRMQIT